MWLVDPTKMCRKHLLGEHVELHMLIGSIQKGRSIQGFIKDGLVELQSIESRHSELVLEMTRRGYNHKSILPTIPYQKMGMVDVVANEKELHRRCRECKF
jgi:hypothetical protein